MFAIERSDNDLQLCESYVDRFDFNPQFVLIYNHYNSYSGYYYFTVYIYITIVGRHKIYDQANELYHSSYSFLTGPYLGVRIFSFFFYIKNRSKWNCKIQKQRRKKGKQNLQYVCVCIYIQFSTGPTYVCSLEKSLNIYSFMHCKYNISTVLM